MERKKYGGLLIIDFCFSRVFLEIGGKFREPSRRQRSDFRRLRTASADFLRKLFFILKIAVEVKPVRIVHDKRRCRGFRFGMESHDFFESVLAQNLQPCVQLRQDNARLFLLRIGIGIFGKGFPRIKTEVAAAVSRADGERCKRRRGKEFRTL